MPAPGGRNSLLNLTWPPGAFVVFEDGRAGVQYGIDDSPGLFHIILARKQGGIACHRVAQYALVCFHFVWTGMTTRDHLDVLAFQCLAGSHYGRPNRDRHLRTYPESQMILRKSVLSDNCRGFAKPGQDLGAGHR